MIYVVTMQQELFDSSSYKTITIEESLAIMKDWRIIQYDSETAGRDCHLCKILTMQFGNKEGDIQIVVDATTVSPLCYKDILESNLLVGQNLKFDLQFLYNYEIIPRNVYDTMIVEQLLHLGFPAGQISYSLQSIAQRRLNIYIDKTVRGEIIWRGIDEKTILYAASDVQHLYRIMQSQIEECREKQCLIGAKLECDFTPSVAYLEWCGIKLDENKWKAKMTKDKDNYIKAKADLDNFLIRCSKEGYNSISSNNFMPFVKINKQGDLFNGFDLEPKPCINWSSSQQVIKLAKVLGFNTIVQDKKTGEDKDSVIEKHLSNQKGICDEFLKLYFAHQGYNKVITSFGQGHLNAINPITGRIHTIYRAIGSASGRMSCGSQQPNDDLAKYKKLIPKDCTYPNIQQLPSDALTRESFVAEPNNLFCSCDFSALEARLGADIYKETHMIDEFIKGSGDMHSLMAKVFFEDIIGADTPTKEIKKKYPELRKKSKSPEFLIQFGGSAFGLSTQLGCSKEEAQKYVDAYYGKFKGINAFKEKGTKEVQEKGYVLINPITGHKMYWWDWKEWKERQKSFTSDFWQDYRLNHKGTGDYIAQEVKTHFKAQSKWSRMALNAPGQGTGCIILKTAVTNLFNWIVDNNYFNRVKLVALVHDETCWEYPETLKDFPKLVEEGMLNAAAKFCKSLPIPAEAAVGKWWIH